MIDHTKEKDRSEIASDEGFTGTFTAFIEWLKDALVYGGVRVHEPSQNDFGRTVTLVETFTGGYSSDELLLGRLKRHWFMAHHWVRSERGGLTVYEFPEWVTNSTDDLVWLDPDSGVIERVYRARTVRVFDAHGSFVEVSYDTDAELAFEEPDRDINTPDGVVIVRPAPPLEKVYAGSTS